MTLKPQSPTARVPLDVGVVTGDDVTMVLPTGTLLPASAQHLRDALLDAVARLPALVVLDVNRMTVPVPTHALAIIDMVIRSSIRWTDTPLRIVSGSEASGWLPARSGPGGPYVRAGVRAVRVYPSRAAVLAVDTAPSRRRALLPLPALARSSPEARRFVRDTCHR